MRATALVTRGMISPLCACPQQVGGGISDVLRVEDQKPRIEVELTAFEHEDIESCEMGSIEVIDVKVNGNGNGESHS